MRTNILVLFNLLIVVNCVTGLDPAAYANPSGQLTTEQVKFYE